MRMLILGVISIFFGTSAFAATECPTDQKAIFCYFASWAVYREDVGRFTVHDIDPMMCTHLVYAFSGLSIYGGIESLDPTNDMTNGGYKDFVALKNQNPCLKTLLAIGGWNQGSMPYSVMVSDEEYRKVFIESVLRLLAVYQFDGLDFDWEYPTERGGTSEDRENFGMLLVELKEKMKQWNLLLTIAVPTSVSVAENAYDMTAINSAVDYVMIMGYDVTPTNSEVTGLLSPMTEIKKVVDFWTSKISKEKIVLGVPAYGRTFTLLNPDKEYSVGAPTDGVGKPGVFTKEAGFLSYYEVILNIQSRYKVVPVHAEENYYAYSGDQWITFEMADNFKAKTRYALEKGIGGMMIWSIDTDDFGGYVNQTTFPIAYAIKEVLHGSR